MDHKPSINDKVENTRKSAHHDKGISTLQTIEPHFYNTFWKNVEALTE